MMDRRLSIVTLGVASVPAARRFYEALGWTASSASQGDDVAFFQLNGLALALYGRSALAADMGLAGADLPAGVLNGFSGYFADPDGHVWEVAHNPFFPLDQNGNLTLPA